MVPKFGIMGAAITTLLAYIVNTSLIYKISQKKYFISLESGRIIKILVLGVGLTVAYWFLPLSNIRPILVSILGPVIYLLLGWTLIVSTIERKTLIEFIRTKASIVLRRLS